VLSSGVGGHRVGARRMCKRRCGRAARGSWRKTKCQLPKVPNRSCCRVFWGLHF
jgi:hypothetical protein